MEVSVPPKIQVFSLGIPATGTPKERRRYRVKWRVDGRDKTRSVKTKVQAERLRSQLQVAADSGAKFGVESGLPES